mmetsp:Transcript_536/g.1117  ORF Transcript_536/g.1117 Transcript_536/m.1117 type:complete len:318 (-) Transcript_536:344-1297(-)
MVALGTSSSLEHILLVVAIQNDFTHSAILLFGRTQALRNVDAFFVALFRCRIFAAFSLFIIDMEIGSIIINIGITVVVYIWCWAVVANLGYVERGIGEAFFPNIVLWLWLLFPLDCGVTTMARRCQLNQNVRGILVVFVQNDSAMLLFRRTRAELASEDTIFSAIFRCRTFAAFVSFLIDMEIGSCSIIISMAHPLRGIRMTLLILIFLEEFHVEFPFHAATGYIVRDAAILPRRRPGIVLPRRILLVAAAAIVIVILLRCCVCLLSAIGPTTFVAAFLPLECGPGARRLLSLPSRRSCGCRFRRVRAASSADAAHR